VIARRVTLALLASLALAGPVSAQAFSVAARAGLDGAAIEATLEVRSYQAWSIRVAPIVTARAAWRSGDLEGSALAGVAVTYLPRESPWAVQVQVHYRVLWSSAGARASPEVLVGVTGALW